jgi:DNA-3-methyladenine glycosylase II
MKIPRESVESGLSHLRARDPVMGRLIERVGLFELRLDRDRFRALVRSILWQQISGAAANAIYARLLEALAPGRLTAENLSCLSAEQLRAAGVSPQKTVYLLDLAGKITLKQVRLHRWNGVADEVIIQELTRIKGIGVWTAQMFLIFSLGRLDVFPHEDLGIRQALRQVYGLETLPDKATCHKIAEPWRPFATIGSWYCWRSLALKLP